MSAAATLSPPPTRAQTTWLILGGSSPIARAFARIVAAEGARVILAGRDVEDLETTAADLTARGATARALAFDARASGDHKEFAAAVDAAAGDGALSVFLAFGDMPDQAEMDADPSLALRCVEASYVGAVSILHHLAGALERRGRGEVAVLGSVAGDRGRLSNYVYGSAKAGLATYAAGLRNRLGRRGVHVLTVKPGFVDTGMTWGLALPPLPVADPRDVAAAVRRAAAARRDVIYVPGFWRLIMFLIRAAPERIFKKLSI